MAKDTIRRRSTATGVGLMLLRAVMDTGSTQAFRECRQDWFLEEEQPAFNMMRAHIRRYGRLPTLDIMQQDGFRFPAADQPITFYSDAVRKRAIFNEFGNHFPALTDAMGARNLEDALQHLRAMIGAAQEFGQTNEMITLTSMAQTILDESFQNRHAQGVPGVTTGWPEIDNLIGGIQGGDVFVIVGRPNIGKTYMLLWSLISAWLAGNRPFITSMEMGTKQLATRIMGMLAGVNPSYIRKGKLSDLAHGRLVDTVDMLDDYPALSLLSGDYRKTIRDIDAAITESECDIAYIDAGYLLQPERRRTNNSRREMIGDVIEELKGIALERNRGIIVTVQFNREVKRGSKAELDLSNIGETDIISQVASGVLGIRDGLSLKLIQTVLEQVDDPEEGGSEWEEVRKEFSANPKNARRLQLIKNREGELGKWWAKFTLNPIDFGVIMPDNVTGANKEGSKTRRRGITDVSDMERTLLEAEI